MLTKLCLCLIILTVGGVSDPGAHRGGQTEDPGLSRIHQLPDAANHTPRRGTGGQPLTYRLFLCRCFRMMMSKTKSIFHECLLSQGVRGLYRGYGSTVLREVGATFLFYSRMCAFNHVKPSAQVNETITRTFISLFLTALISIQPLFGS